MYNFFNPQDGALTPVLGWAGDQAGKPNYEVFTTGGGSYYSLGYDGNNFYQRRYTLAMVNGEETSFPGIKRILNPSNPTDRTDLWLIMSYSAQTYSIALGASNNVAYPFTAGGQVDLSKLAEKNNLASAVDLTKNRYDHSGMFYHDNMTEQYYWNLVIKRFGILGSSWPDITSASQGRPST